MNAQDTRSASFGARDPRRSVLLDRIARAQGALVELARDYAGAPDPSVWRELCRAKATLDALLRVAR